MSLKQSQPEGLRYEFCLSDNGLCFFFSEDCDKLEPLSLCSAETSTEAPFRKIRCRKKQQPRLFRLARLLRLCPAA